MSVKVKSVFIFFTLGLTTFLLYINLNVCLPSPSSPLIFYSNHLNDHLGFLAKKIFKNAKNFLLVHSYAISDNQLLNIFYKKTKSGCKTLLYSDYETSKREISKHPTLNWHLYSGSGLMHEKIFMTDNRLTFLGTANLTHESLNRHDNLILGIYNLELASFIKDHYLHRIQKKPTFNKSFFINNQNISIWFLPDKNDQALNAFLQEIDSAKKSIDIAIYTFTHQKILTHLEKAFNRGVKLNINMDFTSYRGSSKKTFETLRSKNILVNISQKNKLLHYKMMLIDNKNLIIGSSNWTASAFKKNQDFFIVINNLNKKQISKIKKIFKKIKKESINVN